MDRDAGKGGGQMLHACGDTVSFKEKKFIKWEGRSFQGRRSKEDEVGV